MIAVSNGWKAAHNQTLLPETFLEITYAATEPGVQQTATSTATLEESFSNTSQVASTLDKTPEKYTTLEGFGLDGTYEYFDGTPEDPGYVSDVLSGIDGTFETAPVVTITMDTVKTVLIPGVVITWSEVFNEWATDFRVTAWANNTVMAQKTVTGNNSAVSKVWLDIQNYNRITVEILKWSLPYRRARCLEVFLGIQNVYTKTDLMGFTHTQTADLLSAALPKNEITFRLRNEDQRWNPDNPGGLEQYLLERQEIRLRYGMTVGDKTEWIPGGTFWISGWSTPSNGLEASFTARDALEFMNDEYAGPRSGTLYEIAVAAMVQAELPIREDNGGVRYAVSEVLKNYTTELTESHTMAEVLQMVAHAGNCVMYQDRDGVLRVEPWNGHYADYAVGQFISYAHPEYTISRPLKAVSTGYGGGNQRAIVSVNNSGEVQTVDNPLLLTEADAIRVGSRAAEILTNRKVISGEFRADVRLDALDPIIVTSKYASNVIGVTEITYSTTGGTFRGKYTGRVVSIDLKSADRRVGEFYAGEV